MRHFLTLLLVASSSACFVQIARDTEPAAPLVAFVAAAQSPFVQESSARQESLVYVCDSQTAKVYHKSDGCGGLDQCPSEVVEVTNKQAEEDYDRVPCPVCY